MTKSPHRRGRLPIYRREFAVQAAKLVALGAARGDLADFFGVTVRAILKWEKQRPEFAEALKAGRERLKERLERGLAQRALGGTVEAVRVCFPNGSRTPVLVPYQEHVPPDPEAALALLKIRGIDVPREHAPRRRRYGAPAQPEEPPVELILPYPFGRRRSGQRIRSRGSCL